MKPGETYTIGELIRRMIVYSDNDALHLLLSFLTESSPDDDIFAETLAAMGLASNTEVTVVSNTHPGPFVVNVKGSKVMLGRGIAHKITVGSELEASA